MPIPLGFFAVAGAGGGDASTFEQIATASGTGSSGVITFSSIPSTYKHLQVRITAKSTAATIADGRQINLTVNGVTGSSNYSGHWLQGDASSVSSSSFINGSFIRINNTSTRSNETNAYGSSILDILDYGVTTKTKTVRVLMGQISNVNVVEMASGNLFTSTAAITSLTFTLNAGSYATGSRISLFGIKG